MFTKLKQSYTMFIGVTERARERERERASERALPRKRERETSVWSRRVSDSGSEWDRHSDSVTAARAAPAASCCASASSSTQTRSNPGASQPVQKPGCLELNRHRGRSKESRACFFLVFHSKHAMFWHFYKHVKHSFKHLSHLKI